MIFNAQIAILKMSCYAKALMQAQFCAQNVAKNRLAKCFLRPAFN